MNKCFLVVFFGVAMLQGILSASLSTPRPQINNSQANANSQFIFSTGRFAGMTEAQAEKELAKELKEQRSRVKFGATPN